MQALYVKAHADDISNVQLEVIEQSLLPLQLNECRIKIAASGINPSDALATMGYFKHAILPRIPGRDFAGEVVEGPAHLIGKQVWGTGGAAGISFNGTQAEFITLKTDEITEVPTNLSLLSAGAQPLPYVTAYYSLVKRAQIQAQETVLVTGALGQVGQAAMSICRWKNCHAIALVRGKTAVAQAKKRGWAVVDTDEPNVAEQIKAVNNGHPVQVILNSLGNVYWQDFISVLAEGGRIVTIGARESVRDATINLFDLYRANQTMIGVNSVALNFAQNAVLLTELSVGFNQQQLTPLASDAEHIYTPEQATLAYQTVLRGTAQQRIIIQFTR
jgi:NADPH2:quinone reductase